MMMRNQCSKHVRTASNLDSSMETLHLDGATDDVEFHWDVDGGVRHLGEIRHPYLATVTYIEAGGSAAPTAIIDGCHKAPVLQSGEGEVRHGHPQVALTNHAKFASAHLFQKHVRLVRCEARESDTDIHRPVHKALITRNRHWKVRFCPNFSRTPHVRIEPYCSLNTVPVSTLH
eukprot:1189159-Prorocentrum_minimum.AAC.1